MNDLVLKAKTMPRQKIQQQMDFNIIVCAILHIEAFSWEGFGLVVLPFVQVLSIFNQLNKMSSLIMINSYN